MARYTGEKKAEDFVDDLTEEYVKLIKKLDDRLTHWLQIDEPYLVMDLTFEDKALFKRIYDKITAASGGVRLLLQTYFGDVRDIYDQLIQYDFDGIGLDFVEGKKTLDLVETFGFPKNKYLFAGVVNGKNIWRNNYENSLQIIEKLKSKTNAKIVVSTSCSLLHVPYTLENETELSSDYTKHFAFAKEKLKELDFEFRDSMANFIFARHKRGFDMTLI